MRTGTRLGGTRTDLSVLQRAIGDGTLDLHDERERRALGVTFGEILRNELAFEWVLVEWAGERAVGLERQGARLTVYPIDMIAKRVEDDRDIELADLFSFVGRALQNDAAPPGALFAGDDSGEREQVLHFDRPSESLEAFGNELHSLVERLRRDAGLTTAGVRGERFAGIAGLPGESDPIDEGPMGVQFLSAGDRALLFVAGSEPALLELLKEGGPRRTLMHEVRAGIAAALEQYLVENPNDESSFPVIEDAAIDRMFPP